MKHEKRANETVIEELQLYTNFCFMRPIISDYRFLLSIYKVTISYSSRNSSYKMLTVGLLITVFRAY